MTGEHPQDSAAPVPLVGPLLDWAVSTVQVSARRAIALVGLLDRAGTALDDIAELRHSAQSIADNLAELTEAAQGIDTQAARLTTEIQTVSQITPTLQRLTDIVDPLDTTVARLGRFVDRLPGGRRVASRTKDAHVDGGKTHSAGDHHQSPAGCTDQPTHQLERAPCSPTDNP